MRDSSIKIEKAGDSTHDSTRMQHGTQKSALKCIESLPNQQIREAQL